MGGRVKRVGKGEKVPPVHPFDRTFGTDTGGLIRRAELVTGHASDEHVTAYYAVAPSILEKLVDIWLQTRPVKPVEQYTFLDVGAGKGRAMLCASLHPFREVVGVELNPGLAGIARANVKAFSEHGEGPLAPVRVVEGDALEVELPAGPIVAYMFHPFEEPVLRQFLKRVEVLFAGRPGEFDLLYVNAEHGWVVDRFAGFERVFHGMVPMSGEDHLADMAEIAEQEEYGSTGDEICMIYRWRGLPEWGSWD